MISFLQGQLIPQTDDTIIVNVRGVGYEVTISTQTLATLTGKGSVQLWIHTHVREDAIHLFGFSHKAEKDLFLSLIKVSGIGPKSAMKILSAAPLGTIIQLIDDGNARGLSQLPKVGKKTAEQIILELKGKLTIGDTEAPRTAFSARADIVSALVNLGFKLQDVERTVDQFDPATEFEDGVKRGLGQLATL